MWEWLNKAFSEADGLPSSRRILFALVVVFSVPPTCNFSSLYLMSSLSSPSMNSIGYHDSKNHSNFQNLLSGSSTLVSSIHISGTAFFSVVVRAFFCHENEWGKKGLTPNVSQVLLWQGR